MALDQSQVPTLEIAHVLFMDVVAYSRLPMDQQRRVLHRFQQLVSSTSEFIRARAHDELITLPTGDGMALVFFGDAEAPARCALELCRALRNSPEIQLRMGLHTGPVYRVEDVNANRNVAGGGINVAQRVMDCGDAGHILLSSAVAEVLGQLSTWADCLHDLGEVEVKHGLRLHVFNFCKEELGNPERPQKLRSISPAPGPRQAEIPLQKAITPNQKSTSAAANTSSVSWSAPMYPGRTWKLRFPNKKVIPAIVAVLICAVLSTAVVGRYFHHPNFVLEHTLVGHEKNFAIHVAFSPDGRLLASAGGDYSTVKLWELATGREVRTLAGHLSKVLAVSFSPDGRWLASGSLDETVRLWEVATGREVRTLYHGQSVLRITFTPDGRELASAGTDGKVGTENTVKLWEVATGRGVQTLAVPILSCGDAAFSPDGRWLACVEHFDHAVKLWEVATGREALTLKGGADTSFGKLTFSPDGRWLASACYHPYEIRLWEVATGQEFRTISTEYFLETPNESSSISDLAFSHDGHWLVSGGYNWSLKLWEVSTGRETRTLTKNNYSGGSVSSVNFSPDDRWLASGSFDGTVNLWRRKDWPWQ